MSENEALRVIAAKSVRSVDTIDGGDTVAVRMTTADGDGLCVLLPTDAMAEMLFLLAETLDTGTDGATPPARGPSRNRWIG